MLRAEFCLVTGFHPDRLKTLQRRGLLPWAQPEGASRWARREYSLLRAALLVAFDECLQRGLSAEAASRLLLQSEDRIRRGPVTITEETRGHSRARQDSRWPRDHDEPAADIWVGSAFVGSDAEPQFLFGSLKELHLDLTEGLVAFRAPEGSIASVFLVNLTAALRVVMRRAAEHGIPIAVPSKEAENGDTDGRI